MDIFKLLDKEEKEVLNLLKKFFINNNIEAYVVGGAVRDALLDVRPKDIDICVNKDPKEFLKNIPRVKGFKYHPTFSTSTVEFDNGVQIDIIRCRKEFYEFYGALPKVKSSNIKDDLLRRDFTINAIAYNLIEDKLLDICGGINHIKNKVITTITPHSYKEDPTRILRAIKYAERYNFKITQGEEIRNCIKEEVFSTISHERIVKEIILMAQENEWVNMYKACDKLGIMKFNLHILGKDSLLYNYNSIYLEICNIYLSSNSLWIKEALEENSILPRELKEAFKNFKFIEEALCNSESNYEIYNTLKSVNEFYFMILSWNKKLVYKIMLYKQIKNLQFNIKAKDIMAQGIEQGKMIGCVLEYLKKLSLNLNMPLYKNYLENNMGEILHGIEHKNT